MPTSSANSAQDDGALAVPSCAPIQGLFKPQDDTPSLQLFMTALQAATGDATHDDVPATLHRLLAPHRAHLQELRPLGEGGFGRVSLALNKLENRLTALKRVRFNSAVLPWAPASVLEQEHERLLREVRALAALQGCPQVVSYYHAWVEPDWGRLASRMREAAPYLHPQFYSVADSLAAAGAQHQRRRQQQQRRPNGLRRHSSSGRLPMQRSRSLSALNKQLSMPRQVSVPMPPAGLVIEAYDSGGQDSALPCAVGTSDSSGAGPAQQRRCRGTGNGFAVYGIHSSSGSDDDTLLPEASSGNGAGGWWASVPSRRSNMTASSRGTTTRGTSSSCDGGVRFRDESLSEWHNAFGLPSASSGAFGLAQPRLSPRSHHEGRGPRRRTGVRSAPVSSSGTPDASGDDGDEDSSLDSRDSSSGAGGFNERSFKPDRPVPYVLFISMEYVEGCALDEWLWQRNHGGGLVVVTDGVAERRILRDVLLALQHIHGAGFIHRDLKPGNVLITQDDRGRVHAKVGDLGLSVHQDRLFSLDTHTTVITEEAQPPGQRHSHHKQQQHEGRHCRAASAADGVPTGAATGGSGEESSDCRGEDGDDAYPLRRHTNGVGTLTYQAPEQRMKGSPYGSAADVWALGILAVELFSGFTTGAERAHTLTEAQAGRLPQAMQARFPQAAAFATRLLQRDPADRPTVDELLLDPLVGSLGNEEETEEKVGAQEEEEVAAQAAEEVESGADTPAEEEVVTGAARQRPAAECGSGGGSSSSGGGCRPAGPVPPAPAGAAISAGARSGLCRQQQQGAQDEGEECGPLERRPSLGSALQTISKQGDEIAELKRELTAAREQLRRLSTSDLRYGNSGGNGSSSGGGTAGRGRSTRGP